MQVLPWEYFLNNTAYTVVVLSCPIVAGLATDVTAV